MSIEEMAKKFADLEADCCGEFAPEFGLQAWSWVFQQLAPEELAAVADTGPEFFMEDHSEDPIWERVQDLLIFWEEHEYPPGE